MKKVLGLSSNIIALGMISLFAESTASVLKVFSGLLSDRPGKRMSVIPGSERYYS